MANPNTPFGLRPVQNMIASPWTGAVFQFSVPAADPTPIFIGDPVKLAGTPQIIDGKILADVIRANSGDTIVGVMTNAFASTRDSLLYRAASTQRIIYVETDPNALFEIQQGTGGTPFSAGDIGLNANFAVGAGSTFSGMSGVTLNNASGAVTATLDLRIISMPSRVDNDPGVNPATGQDASKFYVRINRHQYANQTAGVA